MTGAADATPSPSVAVVKQALAAMGMRQAELAKLTGLSKDHVSRIMLGKVAFPKSRDTLHALAQALGLDPLSFPEYRHQIQVLPESTRRLAAHLKSRGLSQQEWIRRVSGYSEGHLQLILRGGSAFPKDPATIELFATAAEASPYLFAEYLPLADWGPRVLTAAEQALDPADLGVFRHLWGKIERHYQRQEDGEQAFAERLLQHFLDRAFGGARGATGDRELDDALTYLPPLAAYQPEMRAVLRRWHERHLGVPAVAAATGGEPDMLYALANGQMKLKDGPLKRKLFELLDLDEAAVAEEAASSTPRVLHRESQGGPG